MISKICFVLETKSNFSIDRFVEKKVFNEVSRISAELPKTIPYSVEFCNLASMEIPKVIQYQYAKKYEPITSQDLSNFYPAYCEKNGKKLIFKCLTIATKRTAHH